MVFCWTRVEAQRREAAARMVIEEEARRKAAWRGREEAIGSVGFVG